MTAFMEWSKDISKAPRGYWVTSMKPHFATKKLYETTVFHPQRVIVATKCGKVTLSQWLPEGKERKKPRWEMLGENEEPVAWMPWPEYPLEFIMN